MTDLEANLRSVQVRIAAAAARAGRDPAQITLVAVTKGQPVESIRQAYDLGLRHFGENRVEEAEGKIHLLPDGITWHMIGHIQSRKADRICPAFQVVHSVDSTKLARRLDRFCSDRVEPLAILLECNLSGESSKQGFVVDRWPHDQVQRHLLLDAIEEIVQCAHLRVQGLMTMAPLVTDSGQARPVFASLRRLRDDLAASYPTVDWRCLSMGMTGDFEVAIEEGATHVRIGRAIFAPEQPPWHDSTPSHG